MKISREIKQELKQLIIGMAILNAVAIAVVLFFSFRWQMTLGFLVGYFYMCFNLIFLGVTVTRATSQKSSPAKRTMFSGYALRYLVLGVVVFLCYQTKYINPIGIYVTLFYPKLVLAFSKVFRRKEE